MRGRLFQRSLGVNKHQVSCGLTLPFSKARPGACRTYLNAISSLALLSYTCDVCALHIGLLDDVTKLHVVPFHNYPCI
jgi:hypothetical protein